MGNSEEENIVVVYNNQDILITLGDHGVELTRAEAEKLFIDLGHCLKDQDIAQGLDKI